MTDNQKPLHVRQAEGLRVLADMIEQNPEIAELASYGLRQFYTFHSHTAADHALLAKLGLRYGAKVDKDISDKQYNLELSFADGAVVAHSLASREDVCEWVETGTETVTKSVPDPSVEVPMVEVTETITMGEWRCRPLLAAQSDAAVTA
ncbi:hypothetical protein [Amycolatopsis sp. NPDC051372]|uniref:hypothetical protein n=1 Tax=Amycolatopsis sp. NPDC051372 TaxID=3155669 RepID=UPI003445C0DC